MKVNYFRNWWLQSTVKISRYYFTLQLLGGLITLKVDQKLPSTETQSQNCFRYQVLFKIFNQN